MKAYYRLFEGIKLNGASEIFMLKNAILWYLGGPKVQVDF